MKDCRQFYIDGKWVPPTRAHDFPVIDPATDKLRLEAVAQALYEANSEMADASRAIIAQRDQLLAKKQKALDELNKRIEGVAQMGFKPSVTDLKELTTRIELLERKEPTK